MDKIKIIEEQIRTAAKVIHQLREKNAKMQEAHQKLLGENQLMREENKQVGKLLSELERLREERKEVRKKCENLLEHFKRAGL